MRAAEKEDKEEKPQRTRRKRREETTKNTKGHENRVSFPFWRKPRKALKTRKNKGIQ
jgi:hypothetical protein